MLAEAIAESAAQVLDPEIEAQMAADEAAWGKRDSAELSRDQKGRFTSSESADETPEGDPSDADNQTGGDDANQQGKEQSQTTEKQSAEETEAKAKTGQQPDQKPKTEQQHQDPNKPKADTAKADAADQDKSRSEWARNNERRARTWEEVNKAKAELTAQQEQFRVEREQFQAQQQAAAVQAKDSAGYTVTDYDRAAKGFEQKAGQWQQKAMEAEARGDFAAADDAQAKAAENAQLAKAATERAGALRGSGPGTVWDRLGKDLPEAMQFGGPINTELRQMLRGNPQLMADPLGPYRAALQVGRKVLAATETELGKVKTEAAKVPELQKQIAELSSQLTELKRLTSIPGGGAAISRGGSEKRFEELSLSEMEAQLKAETAQ